MRFPAIGSALSGAAATLQRFPLSIASGLVAFVTAITMIDSGGKDWGPRLLAVAAMGLALFTAARTAAERRGTGRERLWLGYGVVVAGLAALYVVSLEWTGDMAALRLIQLLVLAHLAVATAPYAGAGGRNGFWQYNRFLLLRYLEASFYTLVLFAGLAIALGALNKLFAVKVPNELYPDLLALLGFVFHPWFFLAGVPEDFEALDAREDYPIGLKVFSQFVLIPLVTVYLLILTAYLGKVLVTRTWPSGWIGYLVSTVSLTGVLAVLLVHPVRRRGDTTWINLFARWWFVALLPALVMLLLAVSKRIGQYGITEPRYFLMVLCLWMLAISLYFGLSGSTNIKKIPETLLLVVVLSALGPWSAFAVSKRSQIARLAVVLEVNGMGRPGHITPHRGAVSHPDRGQISAVFRYLVEMHGRSAVGRVLGVPADSLETWPGGNRFDGAEALSAMRRLDLEYVDQWNSGVDHKTFYARSSGAMGADVSGFEVIHSYSFPSGILIGTSTDTLEIARDTLSGGIMVKRDRVPLLTLDLVSAVRSALGRDSTGNKGALTLLAPITLEGQSGSYRVRVVLETVNGEIAAGVLTVNGAEGFVMAAGLRKKP